nr:Rep [Expression shuttle vector pIMB4]
MRTRDARWTLREGLQRVTEDKGLKGCGRSAIAGGVGVVLNGKTAHLSGVATCGKIHLCPVCSAKIRAARSEEIDTVTGAWQAAEHGLAMMTLTLRHCRRMPLGTIRRAERGGLIGVQPGHLHIHTIVLWIRARWVRSVEGQGATGPTTVDSGSTSPGRSAQQFSRYLFKSQDGKARFERWAPGAELTSADKAGRKASRMPFEVAAGAAAGLAEDVPLWQSTSTAPMGSGQSTGPTACGHCSASSCKLDERTDEEIASEDVGGTGVALIPAETWYGVILRHRGRSLDLIRGRRDRRRRRGPVAHHRMGAGVGPGRSPGPGDPDRLTLFWPGGSSRPPGRIGLHRICAGRTGSASRNPLRAPGRARAPGARRRRPIRRISWHGRSRPADERDDDGREPVRLVRRAGPTVRDRAQARVLRADASGAGLPGTAAAAGGGRGGCPGARGRSVGIVSCQLSKRGPRNGVPIRQLSKRLRGRSAP